MKRNAVKHPRLERLKALPINSMLRTALRAAADAGRCWTCGRRVYTEAVQMALETRLVGE